MNKQRRILLCKATACLETAKEYVYTALNEEQEALDNLPENLAGSERYERMSDAVDNLEDAVDQIETSIEAINDASA